MKYKVYRFDIQMEKDQFRLEEFLNKVEGEIVSIIPNNRNISLMQIYGLSRKIDFIFIIVKTTS